MQWVSKYTHISHLKKKKFMYCKKGSMEYKQHILYILNTQKHIHIALIFMWIMLWNTLHYVQWRAFEFSSPNNHNYVLLYFNIQYFVWAALKDTLIKINVDVSTTFQVRYKHFGGAAAAKELSRPKKQLNHPSKASRLTIKSIYILPIYVT